MKNTVDASALKEGRSDEREQVSLANASKRALDQRYEATFTVTTAATGVATTIWNSDDMPINSAWEVQATVLGRASAGGGARGRYVVEGLFYRDAGAAVQEGATLLVVAIESVAALDVQFAVLGNAVTLTVQDDGVRTVDWSAMIKLREVKTS